MKCLFIVNKRQISNDFLFRTTNTLNNELTKISLLQEAYQMSICNYRKTETSITIKQARPMCKGEKNFLELRLVYRKWTK